MMTKTSPLFRSYGRDAIEWYVRRLNAPDLAKQEQISPFEIAKASIGQVIADVSIKPALGLRSNPVSWEDAFQVSSLEEAERLFLDRFPIEDFEFHNNPGCCGMSPHSVSLVLNRKANLIAARTRRGVGNVFILGKTVLEYVNSTGVNSAGGFEPSPLRDCRGNSQWIKVGTFNKVHTIYTRDDIPDDEAIVIYVGYTGEETQIIDAPAALLIDGDEMRLHFRQAIPDAMSVASDYVERFRMIIT